MSLSITAAQVRGRLNGCATLDLSDDTLATAGQIPVAIAITNKYLAKISKDYDTLETNEKAIALGLCIDIAASRSLIHYPKPEAQEGPIRIKPAAAEQYATVIDDLKRCIAEAMELIGCNLWNVRGGVVGGDQGKSDGTYDMTNILYTDTDKTFNWFR